MTPQPPKPDQPKGDPLEQIVRLEREMSQVQTKYKDAEQNYGSELLKPCRRQGLFDEADRQ